MKALFLVSISQEEGQAKGAILLEFESNPNIQAIRCDPDGGDVQSMEKGRFYTREEMIELGY